MKIYSDDGKVFNSVDECKAYETELALKKQKEETEKKARIKKFEEERKVKAEAKEKAMKRVEDCVDLVNQAVKKYEDETGKKLEFVTVNDKLTTREVGYIGKYTRTPSIGLTYNKWWDDLYKELRGY